MSVRERRRTESAAHPSPMPKEVEEELRECLVSGELGPEELSGMAETIRENGWERPEWLPAGELRETEEGREAGNLDLGIKKGPATEEKAFSAEAGNERELKALENASRRTVQKDESNGKVTPDPHSTPTGAENQYPVIGGGGLRPPLDIGEFRFEPDNNIIPFGSQSDADYQNLKADIWATRPRPGLNFIQVFAPYDRTAQIRYSYRMGDDWTVSSGKRWKRLELRMRRDGEETGFVDYRQFVEKEETGWAAPNAPDLFGIEHVRETVPGDYVFVTENIPDYWILNQALSRKLLSRCDEQSLDPREAAGCAVFPYGEYDFSKEAANAELTGRKVVFVDYGNSARASERIRRSARRLSSQGLAESIHILSVDPKIAENGGFYGPLGKWEKDKPEETKRPDHILAYIGAVHDELFGVDGFAESLTEVKAIDDGGRASELIDECRPWEFVLYPVLPKGEINFLAGDSGTGKSQIATDWVERLTNGRLQLGESKYAPDDFGPQVVGWFTMEEDLFKSVFPRARQYGVNLSNFYAFDCLEHPFGDDWYERTIKSHGMDVVVFDSYGMFFEGDNNAERDTVKAMRWLTGLIKKTGVTILLIAHFNKKESAGLVERVAGSHRLKDAVRGGWIAVRDPACEGNVVVAKVKASFVRGTDPVCNFVYQRNSIDDRDAQPEVRLVDDHDRRKLVEIEAMMRAKRKLAGDEAAEEFGLAEKTSQWEKVMRFGLECLERKGYICRNEIAAYSSGLGNTSHKPVDEAVKAIRRDYELDLVCFRKTVFFHLSSEGEGAGSPSPDEKVYVRPSDLSDTREGMLKTIRGLNRRLAANEFSEMIGAPRNKKKLIKQVFDVMVAEGGWTRSQDGSIQPPPGITRGGQIEGQGIMIEGTEPYLL